MDTKTKNKIEAMREGGKALGHVKHELELFTRVGTSFEQIESLAQKLIKDAGMTPSFSTVPQYHWATCVMRNDEVCHGIPKGKYVEDGDVITIDVGLINKGFHLDTTVSFAVGNVSKEIIHFLEVGKESVYNAIKQAKAGNSVYDVSEAMVKPLDKNGYGAVFQLTGHGVGEQLHMEPAIPCLPVKSDKRVKLHQYQTLAIEVMYTMGNPYLVEDKDGWTYKTKDGSLSAMFEETVLVLENSQEILTKSN